MIPSTRIRSDSFRVRAVRALALDEPKPLKGRFREI